jgi:hypothetical protein
MICFGFQGRNGGSNNKSGSLRREKASDSKTGFAKSSGNTIGFNYSSPDVQVCMHFFCCLSKWKK